MRPSQLKNYNEAIICFEQARSLFKAEREVLNIARCDQKIASCLTELGEGDKALEFAQRAIDVFETAHDHRRETWALYEYGKAEILVGKLDDGLATLEGVLQIVAEDDTKDFDFILEIETRISAVLRTIGRIDEADEIDRRLAVVRENLES